MDVLANAMHAFVGGEKVDPKFVSMRIRKRHWDQADDRRTAQQHPEFEAELREKYPAFHEMEGEDKAWAAAGIMLLIDTAAGIATRIRYHGPSLDEIGEIKLVARLAWHRFGRPVSVLTEDKETKSDVLIPMELEIYELDPQNQRIWLIDGDFKEAKLVWPEPGVDTFTCDQIALVDGKEAGG